MSKNNVLNVMGTIVGLEDLEEFGDRAIRVKDIQLWAALFTRFAYLIDDNIDEVEAREALEEYLEKEDIDIISIHQMAALVKDTAFNEEKHRLH